MGARLTDTHPEAARVHLELFRRATPDRRTAIALDLSEEVIALARRGISDANPGLSDRELDLIFVRVHYGEEMARRLSEALSANAR